MVGKLGVKVGIFGMNGVLWGCLAFSIFSLMPQDRPLISFDYAAKTVLRDPANFGIFSGRFIATRVRMCL